MASRKRIGRGIYSQGRKGKPRSTLLTDQQKQNARSEYEAGMWMGDLARKYRVGLRKMRQAIVDAGGRLKGAHNRPILPMAIQQEVISLYQEGSSISEIAIILETTCSTVLRTLHRNNQQMRLPGHMGFAKASKAHRRHQLNEKVFDVITPESAYWLGMLMADGWVTKKNNTFLVGITLAGQDRTHVNSFREFVGSTAKISITLPQRMQGNYNRNLAWRVVFSSRYLGEKLASFGVVPNKSKTAKVIGLENNRDFWRGVVDGDGSLGTFSCGRLIYAKVQLCGSFFLMSQFLDFVKRLCPDCRANVNRHKGIWGVGLGGKNSHEVIDALYSNCRIALPRKKKIADYLLAHCIDGRLNELF